MARQIERDFESITVAAQSCDSWTLDADIPDSTVERDDAQCDCGAWKCGIGLRPGRFDISKLIAIGVTKIRYYW